MLFGKLLVEFLGALEVVVPERVLRLLNARVRGRLKPLIRGERFLHVRRIRHQRTRLVQQRSGLRELPLPHQYVRLAHQRIDIARIARQHAIVLRFRRRIVTHPS